MSLFVVLIVVAGALVVFYTDVRGFRQDALPAIRRRRAGLDQDTPRRRRRYALTTGSLAAVSGVGWFLVVDGVDQSWALVLAALSSAALVAVGFWLLIGWLAEGE